MALYHDMIFYKYNMCRLATGLQSEGRRFLGNFLSYLQICKVSHSRTLKFTQLISATIEGKSKGSGVTLYIVLDSKYKTF
jgi:hypothetical protein